MVNHQATLADFGLDVVNPMATFPVDFTLSLATDGSFWKVNLDGGANDFLSIGNIDYLSYDYRVFSGIAPDAFAPYLSFEFKSMFICLIAFGDVVVDYTAGGTDPCIVYQDRRKPILALEVEGFSIRNLTPGDNVRYQLVVYRGQR